MDELPIWCGCKFYDGVQTVCEPHAEIARLRIENERLKRTMKFQEEQYLKTHGGSWGVCKYQQRVATLERQLEEAKAWVSDLQSGMYVNCVYCGHRYGPGETTPISMADALKAHVEQCPKHPMSALRAQLAEAQEALSKIANCTNGYGDVAGVVCKIARAALKEPK